MESSGDGQAARTDRALAVRSAEVDPPEIRALRRALDRPRLVWAGDAGAAVAGGRAAAITADGPDRFATVRERAETLFAGLDAGDTPRQARPRLYGGFSFTDTHTDPGEGATWERYPGALFVLPAVQLSTTPAGSWLTAAATGPDAGYQAAARLERWRDRLSELVSAGPSPPPGIADRSYAPPLADWRREINEATGRIERGALRKVVLAQALSVRLSEPVDPAAVLERLGDAYPDCFRFLFEPDGGGSFFGATPEQLVAVDGREVTTEALAGSIGRGETATEDEWLAEQLRESEKNNHEHDIVVETISEQLDGLAAEITTGPRTVRKLANVQHLQTPIRARLAGDRHVVDLVEALHPTPAVGGLPPETALETIRDTEVFDRGWYASPVGWIDADGNGSFAVAIRSALAREREATLFAGAGIVADSDPDQEWDELQLKYRPIIDELV
jgi:menaquinone-specific isochorismate synthase